MSMSSKPPMRGVFPVVPTVFDDRGDFDLDGQRRAADFMIDAGSEGLCILEFISDGSARFLTQVAPESVFASHVR